MMTDEVKNVRIADCIGPAYYEMFHSVEAREKMTYWMKGGRGSLKGSFAYLYSIFDLTRDAEQGIKTHVVGLRKVKDTIRDSIFTNLLWAINMFGLQGVWDFTVNPMRIWHIGNGNSILFRGCANQRDFEKIKSLKSLLQKGKLFILVIHQWKILHNIRIKIEEKVIVFVVLV